MPRSRLLFPLLAAALAAACGAEPVPAREARPVGSLAEIAGEWDIVRFDGHSPPRLDSDGLRHAYVDIGPGTLSFAIGCNHSGMPGRIESGVLHPGPNDDRLQTAMGCGREREARDARFFDFFRARPRASLLPDGRLRMASPGHELLLERSAVRRLATGPALAEIIGTWRVVRFIGFGGGGYRAWGAMFAPGRVTIAETRLSYSRCPEASVSFAYSRDFVLRRADGRAPAAIVACPGAEPPATEVEPMLAALLGQSPEVERIDGERFILRSRLYAVVLTGEAAYRRDFGESAAQWERRPG